MPRSLPASTTVTWTLTDAQPKPKLFVITVGIDDYSGTGLRYLRHAMPDAKAVGAAMEAAGEGLYAKIEVTHVVKDLTAERLEQVIDAVGLGSTRATPQPLCGRPRQVGEGPVPFDAAGLPLRTSSALSGGTIGHDKLQDWYANRIKARRGLSDRQLRPYFRPAQRGLMPATRRPRLVTSTRPPGVLCSRLLRLTRWRSKVISAPISAQKHDIFIYAHSMLSSRDTDNNGEIELSELTAHIEKFGAAAEPRTE